MATAEIITIGTELLLGEITDTNSQYLAKALNNEGLDVYRVTTVGDNTTRIAQVIKEAFQRSDLVITTGGLGPTIDDPTREAAAQACGVKTTYHEELWQQIIERFHRSNRTPTENNKRQAFLPETSVGIENEVGTAPAFYMHHKKSLLICLPGVPSEMRFLFEKKCIPLIHQFLPTNAVLITTIIHTIGIGESQIDQLLGNLEKMDNPTIGLAAHMGSVDIRISAKAEDKIHAQEMIRPILSQVQRDLGEFIFGYDEDTIVDVIKSSLLSKQYSLIYNGNVQIPKLSQLIDELQLEYQENMTKYQYNNRKQHCISIQTGLSQKDKKQVYSIELAEDEKKYSEQFIFNSDVSAFEEWALNRLMGTIYKYLKEKDKNGKNTNFA